VEEFGAGNPRHHTITHVKTGVKRDGTLVSHTVDYIVDTGAYAAFKPMGTISGANQAAGPYRIPNVRIDSRFVYTNNIPGGFMRAPGEPQGVFAIESQLDEIAHALGMDPLEIRRKNLIVDGEETAWGEHLDLVKAVETLEAAVKASGYETAPKGPGVGRGIAVGDRGTPGGEGTSEVTLHPDGRVVVGTPIFDQGTGTYTTLIQVASEEIGISPDEVELEIWNTDAVPMDAGVAGSRATRVNSIVCYEAAQAAKKALIELAAKHYGWPEDSMTFSNGAIRRNDIEEVVRWQDLLREADQSISGRFHSEGRMPGPHLTNFVAQVAEVHVDEETGEVKVLKFTTAQETGRIVNPMGHQGQVNGGFIQGIGYAMTEEVKVEDGHVTTLSFGDYKLPSIKDIPELTTVNLTSEDGFGPYNIRSIGEGPHIPVAAAIANAVQDAVGARVRSLPVTSEKVWRALQK
jgi:CO/xanthine dehydrogenase Mo-binding subunit